MTDKSESTIDQPPKLGKFDHIIKFLETLQESQSFFLGGIFLMLLLSALYFTSDIVLPLAFALIFNFLLAPSVKFLNKFYIPISIGAAIVISFTLLIISYGFYLFAQPAVTWIKKGPEVFTIVDQKLASLETIFATPIQFISKVNQEIISVTGSSKLGANSAPILGSIFNITSHFLAELGLTILLLYFLLISKDFLLRKIINWLPTLNKKKEAVLIVHEIEDQIWKYLFARTVINVVLAIVVSFLMYILGMPDPIFWGVLAGILEFIPYVGAIISTIIIALASLLTFHSLGYCFLIVVLFAIIIIIEGNIIFPIVIGRTLTLTPIVVLLGLMFWGWLWGVAGAFIAIPLMVTIKIMFENLYEFSLINELLSE